MEAAGKAIGKVLFDKLLIALSDTLQHDVVDTKIRDAITKDIECVKHSLEKLLTADLNTCIDQMKLGIDLFYNDKRKAAASYFQEAQKKSLEAVNTVTHVEQIIEATRVFCLCAVYEDKCTQGEDDLETSMVACSNRLAEMLKKPPIAHPIKVMAGGLGYGDNIRALFGKGKRKSLCKDIFSNAASLALFFMGRGGKEWPYVEIDEGLTIHTVVYLNRLRKPTEIGEPNDGQESRRFNYRCYSKTDPNSGKIDVIDVIKGELCLSIETNIDQAPIQTQGCLVTFSYEEAQGAVLRITKVQIRLEDNLEDEYAVLEFPERYGNATLPIFLDPVACVNTNRCFILIGTWKGYLGLWHIPTKRCVWDVNLTKICKHHQVKSLRFGNNGNIFVTMNSKGKDKIYSVDIGTHPDMQTSSKDISQKVATEGMASGCC